MKMLLASLASAVLAVIATTAQATLLLYDPFDYPAGERLGGAGSSPVGKVAPNGQTWITRSPASTNYTEARDVLITPGSLSYPGLALSTGNSVRYGSSVTNDPPLYTVAIDIPGEPITEGSVYYSMVVRFHSTNGVLPSGLRTSYAAFSEDTANPATDAGYGVITSSGSTYPLPAGAWIRRHNTTSGFYQLGAGKSNADGMGTSAGAPSWQAAGSPYPNQQGETTGDTQPWATIDTNIYFIVLKYTFVNSGFLNDDTVSIWINPVASTLGHDAGEAQAAAPGGSYYSATNATVTGNYDAATYGIQSFMLIGNAQASTRKDKSIDVTVDELRIGTTWADVTPATPPAAPQIISVVGAGTTSVTVTWTNVQIGADYVLQYNTNLSLAAWSNLPPVTAMGPTASQTDNPPGGDTARFYRVLKP